jgi:uncharacterized coiled-coil protein SlyX
MNVEEIKLELAELTEYLKDITDSGIRKYCEHRIEELEIRLQKLKENE